MNRIAIFEGNGPFEGTKKRRSKKRRKSSSAKRSKSKYTRAAVRSAFGKAAVLCRKSSPGKGSYGTCMKREIRKNLAK